MITGLAPDGTASLAPVNETRDVHYPTMYIDDDGTTFIGNEGTDFHGLDLGLIFPKELEQAVKSKVPVTPPPSSLLSDGRFFSPHCLGPYSTHCLGPNSHTCAVLRGRHCGCCHGAPQRPRPHKPSRVVFLSEGTGRSNVIASPLPQSRAVPVSLQCRKESHFHTCAPLNPACR